MSLPKVLHDNLALPVIGAPMFIVSQPQLVLAQCMAGIVGSFPALNARPKELLDEWLTTLTTEIDAARRADPDTWPTCTMRSARLVARGDRAAVAGLHDGLHELLLDGFLFHV